MKTLAEAFTIGGGVLALMVLGYAQFFFHMMQLEGYKPNQYANWLRGNLRRSLRPALYALPALLAGTLVPTPWNLLAMAVLALGAGAVLFMQDKRRPAKKPLAYTARMKRLMVLFALISVLLCYALAFALGFLPSLLPQAVSLYLVLALSPFTGILALFAALPIEALVNRYYLNDARQKLLKNNKMIRIGITGSYGKTSTKFFLGTILSGQYKTFVTPHSYNTPMGVTRAIRESMPEDTEVFVAEMGARYKGDIAELCKLVSPHHGMITSIGPQHLETFGSQEVINSTKFELIDSLPDGGLALFAADGGLCEGLYDRARSPKGLFGVADGRQVLRAMTATDIEVGPWGSRFTLVDADGEQVRCETRLLGTHNIQNVVGCCAMARHLGLSLEKIAEGVAKLEPVEHRLQLLPTANGVTVIDDAFNSNPSGARAALDVLSAFPGRRIIITPGMVELGAIEEEENEKLGAYMAGRVDEAILVGNKRSQPMVRGLIGAGFEKEHIHVVPSLDAATGVLARVGGAGSVVLFENDLPDNYTE